MTGGEIAIFMPCVLGMKDTQVVGSRTYTVLIV